MGESFLTELVSVTVVECKPTIEDTCVEILSKHIFEDFGRYFWAVSYELVYSDRSLECFIRKVEDHNSTAATER